VVDEHHEMMVKIFAMQVLKTAVLPKPWTRFAEQGRYAYHNQESNATCWEHPLLDRIHDVEHVCRQCFQKPEAERDRFLATFHDAWTQEAAAEFQDWASTKDSEGREYFFNSKTEQVSWWHPAEAVLPFHYIRIEAVRKLRDPEFVAKLRMFAENPSMLSPSSPLAPSSKKGGQASSAASPVIGGRSRSSRRTPAGGRVLQSPGGQIRQNYT
jgi:hypothetical protein